MLWDLIFTLTWHTVFTDVLWPCMINATVQSVSADSRSTKTFPLYRLFPQLWPVKPQWRDWVRDRTGGRCCEEVESGINRCQSYCTVSRWPEMTTLRRCRILTQTQDDTHIPAVPAAGMWPVWPVCEHGAPARVSALSTTNNAPLK